MAALMLVVLLATGLPSRASQFHGPSPARCLAAVERTHGNVIRKVVLPCRDGDPWCDMKRVSAFRKGRIFDEEGCEAAAPPRMAVWESGS